MTKIEELEQRLEVMEQVAKAYGIFKEEVEQLQKALAELKESKKEGKWKPGDGETYWFINDGGESEWAIQEDGDLYDQWRYDNVILFKTREECEKYRHFMDTVKEKSYEFSKEDWEDGEIDKFALHYNYKSKEFGVISMWHNKYLGEFFFKTYDDAQYIIDNFKEELMTYWL